MLNKKHKKLNIWIDLANSPHVLFFLPIINQFRKDGHQLFFTMRDYAQTIPLSKSFNIEGEILGKHAGSNMVRKIFNFLNRTLKLTKYGKNKKIDIAVSHNSYTHAIAGRLIGARVITIMDYEGQPANHLAFRAAHKVIVPTLFPENKLSGFGATKTKTYKYDGFKEQIYLSDFKPKVHFISDLYDTLSVNRSLGIEKKILITIRTPPTMAIYHHFQNSIFEKLLENINNRIDVVGIVLPRDNDQRNEINKKYKNLYIPVNPLDGKNLAYHSDIVISAGGTMNREAAILGTPAYSIFLGSMPAVDMELIRINRMFHIQKIEDLSKISYKKKKKRKILKNISLIDEISREIISK